MHRKCPERNSRRPFHWRSKLPKKWRPKVRVRRIGLWVSFVAPTCASGASVNKRLKLRRMKVWYNFSQGFSFYFYSLRNSFYSLFGAAKQWIKCQNPTNRSLACTARHITRPSKPTKRIPTACTIQRIRICWVSIGLNSRTSIESLVEEPNFYHTFIRRIFKRLFTEAPLAQVGPTNKTQSPMQQTRTFGRLSVEFLKAPFRRKVMRHIWYTRWCNEQNTKPGDATNEKDPI